VSVKVKKCVDALRAYLGKDKKGIELLDTLKDAAHELRTSLAAAKEQLEQAVAIKEAARERADAAEAELAGVRLEQDRLNQMLQGLAKRATAAELEIRKLTTSDDETDNSKPTGDATESEIKATMKAMRSKVRYCVKSLAGVGAMPKTFDREELSAGWKHSDIWLLGAQVATLAVLDGCVTIQTQHGLSKIPWNKDNVDWSVHRQATEWIGKNNYDHTPTAEVEMYTAAGMMGAAHTPRPYRGELPESR
jgi:hypothetical protein